MDRPATVSVRADGYIQDPGSQFVVDAVGARSGERILDLCAAPGGKATALAASGAFVVASDLRPARVGLIATNRDTLSLAPSRLEVLTADGRTPPFRPGSFDRVLVDAPCSGLGSLRRRPDARWRIDESAIESLAALQIDLIESALELVRPGGVLVYSVCTITEAETIAIDREIERRHGELVALDPLAAPWESWGRGAVLLPQTAETDGMYILRLGVPEADSSS
jgi:16S rRNA (cytosine967-C5)-methyltransferase